MWNRRRSSTGAAARRGLHFRISLGAVLPVVVALVAQASYTLISQREAMSAALDGKARSLASLMVNVAGPGIAFDDDAVVVGSLGYVAADPDFGFAAVVAADGRVISMRGADGGAGYRDLGLFGAQVARRGGLSIAVALVPADRRLVVAEDNGAPIGRVYVGLRSERVRAEAASMAVRATAISLLGIVIAVVVVQLLARAIVERNRQMRLVLDNVDEGLVTIHRDGTLDPQCSAAFTRWLGPPAAGHFARQIAGDDVKACAQLTIAWTDLIEAVMPMELLLMQFPTRIVRDGKHLRIEIKPLPGAGALLRIRDITSEVQAQQTLAAQREYVAVVERALADPGGVAELIEETEGWIARLGELDLEELRRAIHTIKGNAAVFGISTVADAAHRIEDELAENNELDPAAARGLVDAWNAFAGRVEAVMPGMRNHLHVARSEVEELAELAEGTPAAARLRRLLLESVATRFESLRPRIARAAENVAKPVPVVAIVADDVWLPRERLREFWYAFAHLIRNAVDHGIEPASERELVGKPEAGRIELRAGVRDGEVVLEIEDDGRGVAWDRVRDKAAAAGLPVATAADLELALFSDRLSTASAISATSGRGVGLAAVNAATRGAGGRITVRSEPGRGTTFAFAFPMTPLVAHELAVRIVQQDGAGNDGPAPFPWTPSIPLPS